MFIERVKKATLFPILSAWFPWEFNRGPGPSQSDLLIFLNIISPEASFVEVTHRTCWKCWDKQSQSNFSFLLLVLNLERCRPPEILEAILIL